MNKNIRIARELVRIAREMVAGQAFYKVIDGKWSVYESDVADKLGFYRRFTGTIDYGQTKATVKGADFGVYAQGHIVFERGTWIDGTWSGGRWEGGTWLNGVWNGGDWYNGTWKNGVWKNGMFGHDETKKSDWMNGTWENGVFETGIWHGGVWKGGKWSDWHQNFWMKGTDGNGVVHGRGECPLKWNEDSNVVVASELVRIAKELVAGKTSNTDEFIEKAKKVHGDKYDYSKVEYIGSYTPVCIVCNECGKEFMQTPRNHLQGCGCPDCGIKSRSLARSSNTEEFIEKAKKVHGDKYDYSKVNYVNGYTCVDIICKKCGKEFKQIPNNHLKGQGCPYCKLDNQRSNTNEFIERAREVHGDKYDYSKVKYVDNRSNVDIICNECGRKFEQVPYHHLEGQGCPYCSGRMRSTTEEFIEKARNVHGGDYDYSKVEYVNRYTPVIIICPKHGEFSQRPANHLRGQGCPECAIEMRTLGKNLPKDPKSRAIDYYERVNELGHRR